MAELIKLENRATRTIAIDDGTQEYEIKNLYGKRICLIHIRPSDFSLFDRYNATMRGLDKLLEPLKDVSLTALGTAEFDAGWKVVKTCENALRGKLKELMDSDDVDEMFSRRNPFSLVGGKFFVVHVLNALGELIQQAIAAEVEQSEKNMAEFLDDLDDSGGQETAEK